MSKKRKSKAERERMFHENEIIRSSKSSNGATGMFHEGFRPPIANRFRKHVSKPYRPI